MADAVAALWTASNFPNATTVASGWTYANTMVKLKSDLNARGVPRDGRFFVANSAVYDSMLTDQYVVSATVNPNNSGAIKSGQVPPLAGFAGVYEDADLPTTGNMVGFAGTKDSVVLVNRVPRDPSKLFSGVSFPGTYQVVTDANTGMSILLTAWQEPVKLELHYRLVWMYGIAKGNANNGQRLITAAP
jgi:hypothetical protein